MAHIDASEDCRHPDLRRCRSARFRGSLRSVLAHAARCRAPIRGARTTARRSRRSPSRGPATLVTAIGGLKVIAGLLPWADAPPIDILVVPGGFGTRALLNDKPTHRLDPRGGRKRLAGHLGLHRRAAARQGRSAQRPARDDALGRPRSAGLARSDDSGRARPRVVSDVVVTSAGVSAGIDMAFSDRRTICAGARCRRDGALHRDPRASAHLEACRTGTGHVQKHQDAVQLRSAGDR